MINLMFEVEDVACPVDDIKTTDRLGSSVQMGWDEGENWGSGYELIGDGPRCRRRKVAETHEAGT
jgi:hypothetical protein